MTALVVLAAGVGATAAGVLGWVLWARSHPTPFPYSQRRLLAVRPYISPERLRDLLEPRPGERILELGPGTGRDAAVIAAALGPNGALDVLDAQQEMLDEVLSRARARGLANVTTSRGDAQRLPWADASFDAAYLVTVLGEIPDQPAALRELARVLKPGGRLVVGELLVDPHFVPLRSLHARAAQVGFRLERRLGRPALGYLARFTRSGGAQAPPDGRPNGSSALPDEDRS